MSTDSWWQRYCKDHSAAIMMLPDRQVRGLPWCPGCLSSWVADRATLERVIAAGTFPSEYVEIALAEATAREGVLQSVVDAALKGEKP